MCAPSAAAVCANIWNGYNLGGFGQLGLIFWVQQKTLRNAYARANKAGAVLTLVVSLLWYGSTAFGAAMLAYVLTITSPRQLAGSAGFLLFVMTCIWQGFPILLGSSGAYIDIRRLLIYPIPVSRLFTLEVVLRISTAIEMGIFLLGAMLGLTINRDLRLWAPLALALFGLFNLLLSTGIKQLLNRLAERKHLRELSFLAVILALLLPQSLILLHDNPTLMDIASKLVPLNRLMPWSAAGKLAGGEQDWRAWAVLGAWIGLSYVFARRQFERMLRLDDSGEQKAARASHRVAGAAGWLELFYRLPGRLFSDPVGAIVEKELRFLSRAPRFRLLFLLACALGQLLWLPQMLRSRTADSSSWLSNNYLTFTCLYAMLVLAENLFLNTFGFDRAAAQNWFVLPVSFHQVLRAKNIVACFFLSACFCLMVLVGSFLPIPHSGLKLAEAAGVCMVYIILMLGVGNLGSVYQPKPVDPQQSWRSNSPGKVQALMMLVYPVMYIPILLAFAARWATGEDWMFFLVLAVDLVLACAFYHVATDSAVEMAARRREEIISTLSAQSGPISIS